MQHALSTSTKGDLKTEVFTAADMAKRVRTATEALVCLNKSGRSINNSCMSSWSRQLQLEVRPAELKLRCVICMLLLGRARRLGPLAVIASNLRAAHCFAAHTSAAMGTQCPSPKYLTAEKAVELDQRLMSTPGFSIDQV
jgi:hypothetical protein